MNNWKTTLFGLISALAMFVLFSPDLNWPPWASALAQFTVMGGLAGLGISASDGNRRPPGPTSTVVNVNAAPVAQEVGTVTTTTTEVAASQEEPPRA